MKILVENGSYEMSNLGDIAMLQVAIARLRRLWPNADITVITGDQERLDYCIPGVKPLCAKAKWDWQKAGLLPLPTEMLNRSPWRSLSSWIQSRSPRIAFEMKSMRALITTHRDSSLIKAFFSAIEDSDLIVASGGGYLTDAFRRQTLSVLDLFSIAQQIGKPTAMFSQGLGPLKEPDLMKQARHVFHRLNNLALRDSLSSPSLLKSLGVSLEHVVVTGDDAVELGYYSRPNTTGNGIGVNLRMAQYSQVESTMLEELRQGLLSSSKILSAPLIPSPITIRGPNNDVESIQQLLPNEDFKDAQQIETPLDLIKSIGRCRVMVTGAYHSAVFALSQGIPVIALAKSPYYYNKLSGLAYQFGVGCEVLMIDQPGFEHSLTGAILSAWEMQPELQRLLLDAAQQQIYKSEAAWAQLIDLFN